METSAIYIEWQNMVTIAKLQKHLRFNIISIKIQNMLFIERENHKIQREAQITPNSRRQIGDITITYLKLYYTGTVKKQNKIKQGTDTKVDTGTKEIEWQR